MGNPMVSREALKLLTALGMPDNCTKFVLTAAVDDVVRAEAHIICRIDAEATEKIVKRFTLVEDED